MFEPENSRMFLAEMLHSLHCSSSVILQRVFVSLAIKLRKAALTLT
jgi:hypothetical protein